MSDARRLAVRLAAAGVVSEVDPIAASPRRSLPSVIANPGQICGITERASATRSSNGKSVATNPRTLT